MLSCLLLLLCTSMSGSADEPEPAIGDSHPVISIIMDDLGYSLDAGRRTLALHSNITVSILPGRPYSRRLAELAANAGNEVMVHLPMQSLKPNYRLGFGGLTETMTIAEFEHNLDRALRSVPNARGLNNHMGSRLTQSRTQMEWLMRALSSKYQSYYFVDSKTTGRSLAQQVAQDHYVPSLSRDVFLDSVRNPAHIRRQISRLTAIAKRRGYAVAIAHPYDETLTILEEKLPAITSSGIAVVAVSTLMHKHWSDSWLASSYH